MATNNITPQQRAANFAVATRQNIHPIGGKQTVTSGNTTVQFTYPKSRLLAKTYLKVSGILNVKHPTKTAYDGAVSPFAGYRTIRRIALDLNNGFAPIVLSGQDLAIYNLVRDRPELIFPQNAGGSLITFPTPGTNLVASVSGTNNSFSYVLEIENVLNKRDPMGLILLQNEQTNVTLTIDINDPAQVLPNGTDFTFSIPSLTIEPFIETFTIPAVQDAFPDLSVLKLVKAKSLSLPSAGEQSIKLDVGTIYRKLLFYITGSDGSPIADTTITSNFELIFNTADTPYQISPTMLRLKNVSDLGYALPAGVWAFDFTNQGIPNYGGSRDYIDTERLSEFVLKFTTSSSANIEVITECLSRLV